MDTKGFLIRAYIEAAKSPSPTNQNGAILSWLDDELYHGHGTINGKTPGEVSRYLKDCGLRQLYLSHAIESLLLGAAAIGIPTSGLTIHVPWFGCMRCARLIILAKIKRIIIHHQRMLQTVDLEAINAQAWVQESGVEIIAFNGQLLEAPPILINGVYWQP